MLASSEQSAFSFDPSGGDILAFALEERRRGRPCVIVTLIDIDGASPRARGAQMAIAASGQFAGSITSGCLERAIVEEALARITSGESGVTRYGKGSKYLDVILPCGSGVDLLFTVNPDAETLAGAYDKWRGRSVTSLAFTKDGAIHATAPAGGAFMRTYLPQLRLAAAGLGAELILLSRIAKAAGYSFHAISPDADTLAQCAADETVHLKSASALPSVSLDPWTAFIFLFHDREWELTLAPKVLGSDAFYIGAVGSKRTHEARCEAMRAAGISEDLITLLKGPVGLIPATRDPAALSVSILAGVLAAWPHAKI